MSLEAFFLKAAPSVLSEIILQAGNKEWKGLKEQDIKVVITDALRKHDLIGQVLDFQKELITTLIKADVIDSSWQFMRSPFLVDTKKVIGKWWEARCYTIDSVYSEMMFGAQNQSKDDGIPIQQLDPNGSYQSKWQLIPIGDLGQPYMIYSQDSNKVLTVVDIVNGASIQQLTYQKRPDQQWVLLPTNNTGKTFKIISVKSSKALDVDANDSSKKKTARIQQWEYHGRTNQMWRLKYVP